MSLMKVKKAIIPVAGLGTRLLPASKSIPKEMFPVVNQPAILYILEEIMDAGIQTVIFIQGRGKTAIEDFFDTSFELEAHLTKKGQDKVLQSIQKVKKSISIFSIRQQKPLGLGHAIYCAKPLLEEEPFAVLLPDELFIGSPNATKVLLSHFENLNTSLVGLMTVAKEDVEKYGIASLKENSKFPPDIHSILSILEKPQKNKAPSLFSCCGRYVFKPQIFKCLKESSSQKNLTDAMNQLAKENTLLSVHFSQQNRYDIGAPLGLLRANIELGLQHPTIAPQLKKYILQLKNNL